MAVFPQGSILTRHQKGSSRAPLNALIKEGDTWVSRHIISVLLLKAKSYLEEPPALVFCLKTEPAHQGVLLSTPGPPGGL